MPTLLYGQSKGIGRFTLPVAGKRNDLYRSTFRYGIHHLILTHLRAFRRTALVTDKDCIAHALHALAWIIPGEVALFGLDELEAAKQWAAG